MPLNMYERVGNGDRKGDAFSGVWESLIKSISLVLNNFALAERIKMLNKLMNCGECANTKDAQGVIRCGCSVCATVCVCVCPCHKTEENCAVKRREKPIDPVDSLCSLERWKGHRQWWLCWCRWWWWCCWGEFTKRHLHLQRGSQGMGGWRVNDWDQNCVNINDIKGRLEIKQTTSQIQWTVPRTQLMLQLLLCFWSNSGLGIKLPMPGCCLGLWHSLPSTLASLLPPSPTYSSGSLCCGCACCLPCFVLVCCLLPAVSCLLSQLDGAIEAQPYCVLCRFSISIHNTRCYFCC